MRSFNETRFSISATPRRRREVARHDDIVSPEQDGVDDVKCATDDRNTLAQQVNAFVAKLAICKQLPSSVIYAYYTKLHEEKYLLCK